VLAERVVTERELQEEIEGKRPIQERGPMVVIVDTSGSMHGLPERVAKALTLEALRTAHAERRGCYLYAYSGRGQVIEHELDLSSDGIGRLLSFFVVTFAGATAFITSARRFARAVSRPSSSPSLKPIEPVSVRMA
jgi:uncharacterized protein with von Willebrand factor type A (vWA) domain